MEPFLGQIQPYGFNFAPRGWAFCDGQLLAISSYSALFSLLGTIYGGDGRSTFGLPDLRGRVMIHQGNGAGLASKPIGQRSGTETVTLTAANLPAHSHALTLGAGIGNSGQGDGKYLAGNAVADTIYSSNAGSGALATGSVGSVGSNASFSIQSPYLVVSVCVALQGVFPSRS